MKRVTIYRKQGNVPPDIPGILNPNNGFTAFIMSKRGKGVALPGILWGWGYNLYGMMGIGNTTNRSTPIAIIPTKTFCAVGGGWLQTIKIDKSGFAWSSGRNGTGELGDNTVISKQTPVSVWGGHTFCRIAGNGVPTGLNQTIGSIDKNGKAWMWGQGTSGELGNNAVLAYCTPVSVWGAHTFCEISVGGAGFTTGIDSSGRAWAWGNNLYGYLGNLSNLSKRTPVSVWGGHTFCQISAGHEHILALDKNGKLWAWGTTAYGNLGNNASGPSQELTPVSVWGAHTFCKISAGEEHSLAIDNHGQLWAWGWNFYGQLGDGTVVSKITPISITNKTFCFVRAALNTTFVMDYKFDTWSWGYNVRGQLGINSTVSKCTPQKVYYNSMKPRYPDY